MAGGFLDFLRSDGSGPKERYRVPFLSRAGVRRAALRDHADLVRAVSGVLLAHDPVGIAASGSPDEYHPEAESIVLRLLDERPTTVERAQGLIHGVMIGYFDRETSGPGERYGEIAAEVWRLWEARG